MEIKSSVYAVGAAIAALVGFFASGLAQGIDHWSTDLQIAYLSDRLPAQHARIALIVVSDDTLKDHAYTSPVDRELIADLVDRVDVAGAKAIGVDFIFDRPTETAKDSRLIDSIRKARSSVVLAALDLRTARSESLRAFQSKFLAEAGRLTGHIYFDENRSPLILSDNVVRYIAKPSPEDPSRRSFAETLAKVDGSHRRPSTPYISWLLPPKNQSETFLTLSAEQVLGRGGAPLPLGDLFRDRFVLIGGNFSDRDQHLTPLSLRSSERYNGLFIHAQILAQLLDGRSIRPLAWPVELLVLVIATCGGLWLGRRDGFRHYQIWINGLGIVGLVAVSALAFALLRVAFPITVTMLFLLAGTTLGYHGGRFVR
jgi:CHASE2 domain-containing sensor protein